MTHSTLRKFAKSLALVLCMGATYGCKTTESGSQSDVLAAGANSRGTLEFPRDNTIVSGEAVQFKWTEHPGAAAYLLSVCAQEPCGNQVIIDRKRIVGTKPTEKLANGSYVWWVQALDANGRYVGTWSHGGKFIVKKMVIHQPEHLTTVSRSGFDLGWAPVPGATHYSLSMCSKSPCPNASDILINGHLIDSRNNSFNTLRVTPAIATRPSNAFPVGAAYIWLKAFKKRADGSYKLITNWSDAREVIIE